MVTMSYEGRDMGFEIIGQEVVLQQDAVLKGLMPLLNLTLRLRMIWCATCVWHAFVFQVVSQRARSALQLIYATWPVKRAMH